MPLTSETGAGAGGKPPAPHALEDNPFSREDPPSTVLTLWPHRSMNRNGFSWVMGVCAVGLAIPLIPFLGTVVGWALLPFLGGTLALLYLFVMRNYRDADLQEVVKLWPDLITVERTERNGISRRWHANPYWVEMKLHDNARIERYLTLKGNGREIELGAFLSPEEREALHDDLDTALRACR